MSIFGFLKRNKKEKNVGVSYGTTNIKELKQSYKNNACATDIALGIDTSALLSSNNESKNCTTDTEHTTETYSSSDCD